MKREITLRQTEYADTIETANTLVEPIVKRLLITYREMVDREDVQLRLSEEINAIKGQPSDANVMRFATEVLEACKTAGIYSHEAWAVVCDLMNADCIYDTLAYTLAAHYGFSETVARASASDVYRHYKKHFR